MTAGIDQYDSLQSCLNRFTAGDDVALNELLSRATTRLKQLTQFMFRDFARVHRWEETDDVLQNASLRLCRALQATRPETVAGFLALASLQIRRELIDLARRYFGPEGLGANHDSRAVAWSDNSSAELSAADASSSSDPRRLALWTDFHDQAGRLPDEDRAVFDLIYYQGLSQIEAAEVLGISERTLQRRWQSARLTLHDALNGRLPV
jgi:RNA polymerase sigma-70 factor (ECF subfamily)